ncbi:MAG: RNA-binding transcriptional accessory protein, partial [Clostridia bacterium]|nr:RNA-binding transcriptional accessory protein [Clostridia bacterium]
MEIVNRIAQEFSIQAWQVENTVKLLDEGNTVPFIARYRKEAHGTLDDQTLREISERLEYLRNLEKRREEVRASIEAQEKLTEEVEKALNDAKTLAEIEDVYRPYKPKRKTRASVAREKGLEPLAEKIFEQAADSLTAEEMAQEFATDEMTAEEALQGAMDIIAEDISDNANIRRRIRNLFTVTGTVTSKAADEETDSVYRQYYEYEEPVKKIAGHRVLAIDRGEREGMLK